MGRMIELTAADGHTLSAYRASPEGQPNGGLVMAQEIFGMTEQLKRCADRYAAKGYAVMLPALFDRVEPNLSVAYTDFQKGGQAAMSISNDDVLADVEAARVAVSDAGRTAIIGYCWGGSVAFMGASRLGFRCAISYYGGGIEKLLPEMRPQVPVLYHFGADDDFIPESAIERIREADPEGVVEVYAGAGHGFCCDDRDSYNEDAATLSEKRSLTFLAQHL